MLIGLISGFLLSSLSWRVNLICLHRGIALGKRSGFLFGLGAAFGDLMYLLLALAGINPFIHYPHAQIVIKWVGISTILIAGILLFNFKMEMHEESKKGGHFGKKSFMFGFLMVLGTPALIVLWLGFFSFLFSLLPQLADSQYFAPLFASGFLCGASLWFIFLNIALLPKISHFSERYFSKSSKIVAVLLFLSAFVLMFGKI